MKAPLFFLLVAVASLGAATEGITQDQKSNVITPEVMNAINAMSKSVGGTGFVSGLGWVDLPPGRELQMSVRDGAGRRWVLGVDQATAKPRTKICVADDGTLAVVDDKTEPKYGLVSGQPVTALVGAAINGQLRAIAKSNAIALIKSITVYSSPKPTYVVSWESTASGDGSFAIDAEGKAASVPKEK